MQGSILKEAVRALSNQQAEEARNLFANILTTHKNLYLYPEDHSICQESIKQLHAKLEAYIRQNGDVTIEIERTRVICQGLEVKTGPLEEGTLPHTLFRDGVGWLQLTEGISVEELRQVFSIIRRYSVTTAEPQGDIVTDFWEARFEHMQYKADDYFSENVPEPDDSSVSSEATPSASGATEEVRISDKPLFSSIVDIDPAVFELSLQEELALQEMVDREEQASVAEHLNMLLDMLLQHEDKKDFSLVLEVLNEEYRGSFVRHDFESAFVILYGVREVMNTGRLEASWARDLLGTFYDQMSSDAESLKPLADIWGILDGQQAETLQHLFQLLNTPVVNFLATLLTVQQPQPHEQIIDHAVFSLISRDTGCLESLIAGSDEKTIVKLIPILSRLEKEIFWKHLRKLAGHPATQVRRKTLSQMLEEGDSASSSIFEFLHDRDVSIRRMVLSHMGKSRDERAEKFLLDYLQSKSLSDAQDDFVVACFRALGKCGSETSIPFLRKTLMQWMSGSKASLYRQSAARALAALKIPNAQQVLEMAGKSLRPGVRKIVREAEESLDYQYKGGR